MNAELLLAYYDRISDAPDAVARLRKFILDLAVRGKLVEQDSSDEPASKLLARIQIEKQRFARTGNARQSKHLPKVERADMAFPAPPGWEWTRIRQITSDRGQTTPKSEFTYIDVTSINKEAGSIADVKVLGPTDAPSRARKVVETGDVLYSCVRPYLLNIAIIETEIVPAPIASTAFAVLNGFSLVIPKYLWVTLRSSFFVECVEGKMRGQSYPAINDSDFSILPFPLPPLAEQHRIVAKVDELMALCDRLEVMQREQETRRDQLTASAHHHLNNGGDAEELRTHAKFFIGRLPRLAKRPNQIKQLRQTILDLAIRGLLTRNLNDRDGTSLLPGSEVFERKISFPPTWSIQTLSEVASVIVDCPHSTPHWTNAGKICVRTNQFRPGYLNLTDVRYVSESTYLERIDRLRPIENDILYSREGGILGIACRIPPNTEVCLGQRMMLIRSGKKTIPAYLELVLNSPLVTSLAAKKTTGGAAPRINVATVKAYPIPLPPFAEQHRIVAKVDELMALCDQLEASLSTAQTETSRLLESVLHHALEASA